MTDSSRVLRELPLPDPIEVGFDPDTRDDDLSTASSFRSSLSCCLCPHALARKSQIYGRTIRRRKQTDSNADNNINNNNYHDTTWLSWRTSLAPHCVTQIVSNHDGSILAAATDRGTVSLLRGSDGKVLATRQVSQTATQLCFVPTKSKDKEGDTLLIQTQVDGDDDDVLNCVVVSNIQGAKLNGRPESAAEAARQMKIRALPRLTDVPGWRGIVRVTALYRNGESTSSVLLLVTVTQEGNLRIFEWDLEQGTLTMITEKVSVQLAKDGTDWVVDSRLGFMTHPVDDLIYIVFVAYAPGVAALVWLDPESKEIVCHVPLHVRSAQVGVFMPLPSYESAVAVAVAVKTETTPQIHVYQLVVEETMGLMGLTKPHLVFSVQLSCALHEVSLAATLHDEIYGFAYEFKRAGQSIVTEVFPSNSPLAVIGKIRYLLQTEQYDEADALVVALGEDTLDPLANFHPSEVTSARLRRMITSEMPKQEMIGICLHRLAKSAMTLNETAVQTFAQACELISDRVLNERADNQIVVIEQVLRFVESVIDSALSLESTVIKDVENILRDRRRALRFVAAIPDVEASDALLGIKSTQDLLKNLLSRGDYLLIQKLWDWEGGKGLSVDMLLAEIVNLPSTVDPVAYLPLLKHILLPNLTIHHELLPILRAWTCHTADSMDENQVGLPPAIALLETVQQGIRNLRQNQHSSFAIISPFVEGLQPRKPKRSTLATMGRSSLKAARIETTTKLSSSRSKQLPVLRPPPTIIQMGGLKAGAAKAVVQRIGKWSTSQDIDEECVEQKLIAARCLSRARSLGLPRSSILLRDFGGEHGLEDCTRSLVLSLSEKANSHEERLALLRERAKAFCDEFGSGFDEGLLHYVSSLCKDTPVTGSKFRDAASISRCCWSDENKSVGTLSVVRAAILCGYAEDWLLQQAREAVEWSSSNSSLQSEMREAARLLLIDSIITKYCGRGARELFRVDNPKHAINLMDFVVRRVKSPDQINDILELCDAFLHLAKRDSVVFVTRQAITYGESDLCIGIVAALYESDATLADKVLAGSLSYIVELLSEKSSMDDGSLELSKEAMSFIKQSTMIGCELLSLAVQLGREISSHFESDVDCFLNGNTLGQFHDQFLRLNELQDRHEIFLSLSDLSSPEKQIIATVSALQRAMEAYVIDDFKGFLTKVKKAERASALLTGRKSEEKQDIWKVALSCVAESLVSRLDPMNFCKFLNSAGFFDGEESGIACRGLLRLAMSLCSNYSQEDNNLDILAQAYELSLAASLVRDHAIRMSDSSTLLCVVDVDSCLDSCHSILTMTDNGHGDKVIAFRESIVAISPNNPSNCNKQRQDVFEQLLVHQPSLHPLWYHGDGLLLPPDQSTSTLKWFCRSTLRQASTANQASTELQRLLSEKGSNFSRLRILNVFWSQFLVSPSLRLTKTICEEVSADLENSLQSLAERSVGGTGVGMTSGTIDSELSVAFLLSLPVKLAFKIYTSTIPTALKTQQFRRLYTLANIGKAICTGAADAIPEQYRNTAWTRQRRFFDQCCNLALQASWWVRFSELGVHFDPGQFDDSDTSNQEKYASSLIMPCVATLSKQFDVSTVLEITSAFAKDFGVDIAKVFESHVEYMVSSLPSIDGQVLSPPDAVDHRIDISSCSKIAKQSLRFLKPLDRTKVLRRCVKSFELQNQALVDYERFASVLFLYREALIAVLDKESIDPVPFEVELELVDRRKDSLEILSSYFCGTRIAMRPDFLGFFVPFDRIFGKSSRVDNSSLSILGGGQDQFDPLAPLRPIMLSSDNVASSAALSPLCSPLGLPQGYIRARFLMARFELSIENNTSLPSFENEVEPVFERLRSPKDKTVFAEWVARRYSSQDEDRLKCYELALQAAMQNSSEIEFRRRTTPGLGELEAKSLETVRRITIAKSALSDKLRVVAILRSGSGGKGSCMDRLISCLLSRLKEQAVLSPDGLIDFLLKNASSLASEWTIDATKSLSTTQMRHFADVLNRVCTSLSEQHSHIDPQRQARLLASHWLFRGNTDIDDQSNGVVSIIPDEHMPSIQDDDNESVDFVLDLDGLQQNWNPKPLFVADQQQTSEEEPSALKEVSFLEESENDACCAALRIAFVLASALERSKGVDENMSPRARQGIDSSGTKKRFGVLSKIDSKKDYYSSNDAAQRLGQQLLKVAFAKKIFKVDAFNDSLHSSMISETDGYTIKTITYAMRHRALRAAAILCPQEILEEICSNEAYLRLELEMKNTTLAKCSFGVFVAKEIEEMGLQLPHSDLPQLSSMNFPSYARTLWRHNRDTCHLVSKGRLLLLLIQMTLKDDVADCEFVGILLKEMSRIVLPRSLLKALECIAESRHAMTCKDSNSSGLALLKALESTANAIVSEVIAWTSSEDADKAHISSVVVTLGRLSRLMISFSGIEEAPKLKSFVGILNKVSCQTKFDQVKVFIRSIVQDIDRHQACLGLTLRSTV